MDKKCEECYFHVVEDCSGISDDEEWTENCFQSIEDMSDENA